MTIDDIGGEHVRRVGIGIAQEISKTHGWKRITVTERAFIELDHSRICLSSDISDFGTPYARAPKFDVLGTEWRDSA